ncbi:hypothetical protein EX30DRAFT_4449 [Ascodesmis nigricans]|uniref:Uncharacterized protein n=1 Tax=Ascodesmis nigricans TaxID=341454 RepID=A0A4S2N603_9PEZI|nr:hypothetical protein EX30DRAFT_4449 [Ascodesmis nigricans]
MAPHTHTPPPGSHHQPHRPHHHPQHQHGLGGVRPAVPEMNRRRGNSVIIPAVPPMPQIQHLQQQQIQHHQYLQHQQPYYPVHPYAHPHLQHHPAQAHSRISRQPQHAPQPQPPPLPPPPPPPLPVTHQIEEYTPPSPSSTLSGLSLPPRPDSQATLVEEPLEPPPRPFFRPPDGPSYHGIAHRGLSHQGVAKFENQRRQQLLLHPNLKNHLQQRRFLALRLPQYQPLRLKLILLIQLHLLPPLPLLSSLQFGLRPPHRPLRHPRLFH